MRFYLLICKEEFREKEGMTFSHKANYVHRLIKDVGLYGACYLLYDQKEKQIIEKGSIHHIDYYEKEEKYQAFFEDRIQLKHPLEIETRENDCIMPLSMTDIKKIGIRI